MAVNVLNAAAAYANAARAGSSPGMEARPSPGGGFAEMVKEAVGNSIETLQAAEQQSLKAATKEADILEVVTAVGNAEVTLQSVVAVRDRVVQAYQEIMRMPI